MQAITTTSKKIKGKRAIVITARTASGRSVRNQVYEADFSSHAYAARELSRRMGWGEGLYAGETKAGFAFIPVAAGSTSWDGIAKAAKTISEAAKAFPAYSPETVASGIIKIAKEGK